MLQNVKIVLLGNKSDLGVCETCKEEAEMILEKQALDGYLEVSAKTDKNIDRIIEEILCYESAAPKDD